MSRGLRDILCQLETIHVDRTIWNVSFRGLTRSNTITIINTG